MDEEYRKELIKEISIVCFKSMLDKEDMTTSSLNFSAEKIVEFVNTVINEMHMNNPG